MNDDRAEITAFEEPQIVECLAACLLGFAVILEASDNSTVNFGANQSITAFSTCKKVTNGSGTGLNVYVPTQSDAEWQSFYTNPPYRLSTYKPAPMTGESPRRPGYL